MDRATGRGDVDGGGGGVDSEQGKNSRSGGGDGVGNSPETIPEKIQLVIASRLRVLKHFSLIKQVLIMPIRYKKLAHIWSFV